MYNPDMTALRRDVQRSFPFAVHFIDDQMALFAVQEVANLKRIPRTSLTELERISIAKFLDRIFDNFEFLDRRNRSRFRMSTESENEQYQPCLNGRILRQNAAATDCHCSSSSPTHPE